MTGRANQTCRAVEAGRQVNSSDPSTVLHQAILAATVTQPTDLRVDVRRMLTQEGCHVAVFEQYTLLDLQYNRWSRRGRQTAGYNASRKAGQRYATIGPISTPFTTP